MPFMLFIIIPLVLLVVILLISCISLVPQATAYVVEWLGVYNTTWEAGLHFKVPFLESVKYFPKAIMFYDIPPSEVLTSDKQNMTVDSYVLWRIQDPLLFYQTLGGTAAAEQRLDALTYNALKTVMGTLAQQDIINYEDGAARNDIYAVSYTHLTLPTTSRV